MTPWTFIRRGMWHYRGSELGVLAGAALGAAVLLGALMAGDSVKGTLREIAAGRIGQTDYVFTGGEGFFGAQLAERVRGDDVGTAPVLMMEGQVSARASGRGTGQVQIVGVDDRFWKMAPAAGTAMPLAEREVAVNRHLADSLDLREGAQVVLRMQEPGLLSRDAPLSGEAEEVISFRGTVRHVAGDEAFGRFGLRTSQLPAPTVFVPLGRLQELIGYPGRANLLLVDVLRDGMEAEGLRERIHSAMRIEDYGFSLVDIPLAGAVELRSGRIFIEPEIVEALRSVFPGAQPVLSYLANTLAVGERETPYSMVTAVDPAAAPFLPEDLGRDEIVINDWLADDLDAAPGDQLELSYFRLAGSNRLEVAERGFRVRKVVPMEGLAADRLWMPDFPGVAEAGNARDWSPGLPLDLDRIRPKDEEYWEEFRGTPKAFLSIEAGREMFANRWGDATALRIPAAGRERQEVRGRILGAIRPWMAGFVLRDFRAEALEAARSPVDIAGLFLSMSVFLIVAAVGLVAMLFRFNVEQRGRESGLLAAVGVSSRKLLRWRLMEGLLVVVAGALLGFAGATGYSLGILRFLETIWSSGGGGRLFTFHLDPGSMAWGLGGFVGVAMLAIWLAVRRQVRQSASLRLEAGSEEVRRGSGGGRRQLLAAALCMAAGGGALFLSPAMGPQGAFFLSGAAFLAGGLWGYRGWLTVRGARPRSVLTPSSLAMLNSGRRPMRSLVVVGTMACGVFLVISVTAFRKHGGAGLTRKSSGTGGYTFWIETTSPVNRAAATDREQDFFELGGRRDMLGAVQPFRAGAGDDASCFNLNTASRPRLLATGVGALAERGAFSLRDVAPGLDREKGWRLLEEPGGPGVLRAFLDETTMMWVLKKRLGDRITYRDEQGEEFEVEISGTLADSVFQGSFVVDEEQFLDYYPSQEGYSLFLADAAEDPASVRKVLQKAIADRGGAVTMARERLESFHAVENTYIAIFHVLGGLGLLLGSAGLGIVTARNLVERRREFAMLETIGVPPGVSRRVVFKEVRSFIAWALAIGVAAALVSIVPALGEAPPVKTLAGFLILVVAMALHGLFWAWVGYALAGRRTGTTGIPASLLI